MKIMEGDEAFYYLHDGEGFLKGAVITHVDDFTVAGTSSFIEEVLDIVERELTISEIEREISNLLVLMSLPKKMG